MSGTHAPDRLVREADAAMYEAKNTGKARYAIYDSALSSRAQLYIQLEGELRRAVEQRDFVVHYQPIVDMETGEMPEVEALVRWHHPERGIVPPASSFHWPRKRG
jgi:predicted signal transduction protein with EAL and GGDEF domain